MTFLIWFISSTKDLVLLQWNNLKFLNCLSLKDMKDSTCPSGLKRLLLDDSKGPQNKNLLIINIVEGFNPYRTIKCGSNVCSNLKISHKYYCGDAEPYLRTWKQLHRPVGQKRKPRNKSTHPWIEVPRIIIEKDWSVNGAG